jgi:hypothetical protein
VNDVDGQVGADGLEVDGSADEVDRRLGDAELVESAGVQSSVAVAGPGALVMVPIAVLLVALKRLLRRRPPKTVG